MRSSLHRVEDELDIFGVDSKKIFRIFKDDQAWVFVIL